MSQVTAKQVQLPPGQCVRLSDIDWRTYSRLLKVFAERPGVRLTYDRGELEIMSPSLRHDDVSRFLSALVFALAGAFGLPLWAGGSTTLRRQLRRRGIEADECFWIGANADRVAGRDRLNLRTDPPPDLAIEVDVTHSSLDRLGIYAALGVPELWRLDGDALVFYTLSPDGTYANTRASRSFPPVTPADLLGFLTQARQSRNMAAVLLQFQEWARQLHASGGPPTNP